MFWLRPILLLAGALFIVLLFWWERRRPRQAAGAGGGAARTERTERPERSERSERTEPSFEAAAPAGSDREQRRALPVIDSVFPLAGAQAAHERLESGAQLGKVLLRIPE